MFHALGREQIRAIVELQLQRVAQHRGARRTSQLEFDKSLVDHLAEVGYDPEFGARMLKRSMRSEVESRLANALLKGEVQAGEPCAPELRSGPQGGSHREGRRAGIRSARAEAMPAAA